jgi:D-glycerate 3-kinase
VALVSLDDYYLPRAERALLARTVHPLLATRGVPGTHDVDALQTCLEQLRVAEADSRVELYTFSKAEDDRSQARSYEGACDVVLLEGWCVMARPQHERELVEPINDLERQHDVDGRFRAYVNAQLRGAYAALWRQLSVRVFLAAPDFTSVHAFRAEQEHKLATRAPGAAGLMTPEQLRHFIEHYQRISVHMLSSAPADADAVVWLDPQRGVRALELR